MALLSEWRKWLRGLGSAFIGGGASAVTSGAIVGLQDPEHFNLSGGSLMLLELIGSMFLLNGLMSIMFYLKQSPLPEEHEEPRA